MLRPSGRRSSKSPAAQITTRLPGKCNDFFYRIIQNFDASFRSTLCTRKSSDPPTKSNWEPSHGSRKIRSSSKCSASKPAFVFVEASSLRGDTKTIRALVIAPRGSASSVSKTWFTVPNWFGQMIIGVARNEVIKSRELKPSPSGLSKPPAPSTSKTSKRFCIARTCAITCDSFTRFRSWRAASNGVTGARKCHGLISSSVSAPPSAACRAWASARPPEQTGLSAAALRPRLRKYRVSSAVSTVLPTPVSVPVMKIVSGRIPTTSKRKRGWQAIKTIDVPDAIRLSCAAR